MMYLWITTINITVEMDNGHHQHNDHAGKKKRNHTNHTNMIADF